jgi:hypothetical protein
MNALEYNVILANSKRNKLLKDAKLANRAVSNLPKKYLMSGKLMLVAIVIELEYTNKEDIIEV